VLHGASAPRALTVDPLWAQPGLFLPHLRKRAVLRGAPAAAQRRPARCCAGLTRAGVTLEAMYSGHGSTAGASFRTDVNALCVPTHSPARQTAMDFVFRLTMEDEPFEMFGHDAIQCVPSSRNADSLAGPAVRSVSMHSSPTLLPLAAAAGASTTPRA
jgi:hypothetical protein